jgi:hypothetical protein
MSAVTIFSFEKTKQGTNGRLSKYHFLILTSILKILHVFLSV